jgi:hypothetical protein
MTKQIIKKDGKAAFVVIPIEEWRRDPGRRSPGQGHA